MHWKHFFLPHPDTHNKAHLLSLPALTVYIAIAIFLQVFLSWTWNAKPGVLGISAEMNVGEIIRLTNEKRAENGQPPLSEDPKLNVAAYGKAQNMFAENYWAHFSPSGKDPWGFISGAGYKFTYAGENLARNFYTPREVVDAWMASPTHRDNIVNSKYKNIGISIVEGTLDGHPTLLVVQMFGTPTTEYVAYVPQAAANTQPAASQKPEAAKAPAAVTATQSPAPKATASPAAAVTPPVPVPFVAGSSEITTPVPPVRVASSVFRDPNLISKYFGYGVLFFLGVLLLVDLYVIRRRAVVRVTSRHLPHLAFMAVTASAIFNMGGGSIL